MRPKRPIVVGGAGFIGSHVTERFLSIPTVEQVLVFDNFSSGQRHLPQAGMRLRVLVGDAGHLDALVAAMEGCDLVIHLASNPDIARAVSEPGIDFFQGTVLTHNVLEAMRIAGVSTILYASGSGVYGDRGDLEISEDQGPLLPISTYGASKLAGEALIAAYSHLFGFSGRVFRFANVVGPRQTHGVGFDFMRRLAADPARLLILGDGSQSKSYIHVNDVVDALLITLDREPAPFRAYNVATQDHVTVREIAELAVQCAGLQPDGVHFEFTGGDRGWVGDVPVVRLNSNRIRSLGWRNQMSSEEALEASLRAMATEWLAVS